MPLQQGEVSLLVLFADIHTYLAPPTSKPVHHRFDRRSYLYLFHDALNKRGRVEIANNAGTPDQDAFSGYLDVARVEYSYKQPTLFTITVDSSGAVAGTPQTDLSQWHLPSFDPKNENKYMYKVHTLDVYLWTVEDASLFLDSLKRVLQPAQLVLSNVPADVHAEHTNSMSPVVQQLERVAVSTHPRRTDSVSTTQSFPPPPPQPVNGTPTNVPQSPPATQQNFAPIAYNPAAPAAPEQRAHREKTPPPPDAESGTGLTGAAHHEQPAYFGGPPQGGFAPQQSSYMPGPPSVASPPQGLARTSTMGPLGAIPPPPHSASPYQQSFAPPPQATPPQDPNAHLYAQQPGTPGLQRQSTIPYQPGQPSTTQQYASYPSAIGGAPNGPTSPGYAPLQSPSFAPQPPAGYGPQATQAYSQNYPFSASNTQHSMHQQVYFPEGSSTPAQAGAGAGGGSGKMDPGKLDARMDRLEKGVGRFLKRLDKKI